MPFYTKSPRKSQRGLLFSISEQIIPACHRNLPWRSLRGSRDIVIRRIPPIRPALEANGNVKAVLDVRHDHRAQKELRAMAKAKHEHFK